VIAASRHYFGTWSDDYQLELEELIDGGASILVVLHEHGHGRGSGVPFSRRFTQVWTFQAGRIVRWEIFADRAAALEAAGLSESVEVLRSHFRAFASGGLDAMAEFWHPDIEWRAVEGAADAVGVMRGHDALRRYYQDWIESLDELCADVDKVLLDEGDRVVAAVRNSGRGRVSGAPVAGRYYVACIVREGQIVAGREFGAPHEALDAVENLK